MPPHGDSKLFRNDEQVISLRYVMHRRVSLGISRALGAQTYGDTSYSSPSSAFLGGAECEMWPSTARRLRSPHQLEGGRSGPSICFDRLLWASTCSHESI